MVLTFDFCLKDEILPINRDKSRFRFPLTLRYGTGRMTVLTFFVAMKKKFICLLSVAVNQSVEVILWISGGMGKKDRQVPLSVNILEMLRNYYLRFLPKKYVFEEHQSAHATP